MEAVTLRIAADCRRVITLGHLGNLTEIRAAGVDEAQAITPEEALVHEAVFLVRTEEELAGHDAKAHITVGEAGNAADFAQHISGHWHQSNVIIHRAKELGRARCITLLDAFGPEIHQGQVAHPTFSYRTAQCPREEGNARPDVSGITELQRGAGCG